MPESVLRTLKWKIRRTLNTLHLWDQFELARLCARLVFKRPDESDLGFFGNFDGEKSLFLDVGANIGQTAVSLRIFNRSAQIISFEPNPLLAPRLKALKRFIRNFDFKIVGIGEKDEMKTFYVPFVEGAPFTQETSAVRELLESHPLTRSRIRNLAGDSVIELRSFEMEIRRLDDFALEPDFIKLDVQGYELSALKGSEKTLTHKKPILMIENYDGIVQVGEYLESRGYGPGLYYSAADNQLRKVFDLDGQLNVFFVPREKEQLLESKGLLDLKDRKTS